MSKKFTIKGHRLRARARRRKASFKINAPVFNRKETVEEQNQEIIKKLEAKLKAEG